MKYQEISLTRHVGWHTHSQAKATHMLASRRLMAVKYFMKVVVIYSFSIQILGLSHYFGVMNRFDVLFLFVLTSCNSGSHFPESHEFPIANSSFTGKVIFQELSSTTGFKILLQNQWEEITDQTIFRYVPYRFDTADVNHDGNTEIIVGLTKSTRFDPSEKKRLFILRIDENQIRPLWLGSKVCQELIDFKSLGNGYLQTLERATAGKFSIGKYYWQGFGLTLEKYTHNEITLDHAHQIFKN